jgi:transposase-like protein
MKRTEIIIETERLLVRSERPSMDAWCAVCGERIFIASADGLKGSPEAIESVFPQTEVQLCVVHLVGYSLNSVGWKQRKEVVTDLKIIYTAATDGEAEQRPAEFSLYMTKPFESLNMSPRKVTKARESFPSDEAVSKLLFLALRNIAKKWTLPVRDWKAALKLLRNHLRKPDAGELSRGADRGMNQLRKKPGYAPNAANKLR